MGRDERRAPDAAHRPRRAGRGPAVFLIVLCLAVGGAGATAFRAGLLGEVVLETRRREPLERVTLPPIKVGILDLAGRDCPGGEPAAPDAVAAWRAWVKQLNWSPATLAGGDWLEGLAGTSLVVVPGTACLSSREAAALRAHVRDGGGLLAVGLLGVRDERDRSVGWRLLEEMAEAERFEALPDGRPILVAFRDGSPLAAGLEASTLSPPPRGRVVAVATGPHPYWCDSSLQPVDPSLPQGYQSAALTAPFGRGRVAWLGFRLRPTLDASLEAPEDRLLRNAAAWAAGMPVVSLAPWPSPHRSAVLLRANLAGRPRNASFVARTFLDARVHGVFVVGDEVLDELAGLEEQLSRAGQVALAAPRVPFPAPSARWSNAARRVRVRRALAAWPTGLLARDGSEEQAAHATAEAGLDFFLMESASGAGRPSVRRATRRWGPWRRDLDVVGFGRLTADDLTLSPLGFAGLRPEWVRRRLLADFDVTAALGGLHVLSFHTHGLGGPDGTETLSWLITQFAARGAWIAGPRALVGWSRARSGLELRAEATAGRLTLRLHASAGRPDGPVVVDVHPPPATHAMVVPGSADCRVDGPPRAEVERLLVLGREQARDYRCEVRFVP